MNDLFTLQALKSMGFDTENMYYLSGPMSGYPNYNYEAFDAAANWLRSMGLEIASPHELERPENWESMSQSDLWTHMMVLCHEQMSRCDGIIVMKGWPQSRGAVQEMMYALRAGWPVWFFNQFTGSLSSMNKGPEG